MLYGAAIAPCLSSSSRLSHPYRSSPAARRAGGACQSRIEHASPGTVATRRAAEPHGPRRKRRTASAPVSETCARVGAACAANLLLLRAHTGARPPQPPSHRAALIAAAAPRGRTRACGAGSAVAQAARGRASAVVRAAARLFALLALLTFGAHRLSAVLGLVLLLLLLLLLRAPTAVRRSSTSRGPNAKAPNP